MKLTIKQHEFELPGVHLCLFFFFSSIVNTIVQHYSRLVGNPRDAEPQIQRNFGETILWRAGLGVILWFFTVGRVVPLTPGCSESTICSSLALSMLTLYNHHYHPSPEFFFIFANWIPLHSLNADPSIPLYPSWLCLTYFLLWFCHFQGWST